MEKTMLNAVKNKERLIGRIKFDTEQKAVAFINRRLPHNYQAYQKALVVYFWNKRNGLPSKIIHQYCSCDCHPELKDFIEGRSNEDIDISQFIYD